VKVNYAKFGDLLPNRKPLLGDKAMSEDVIETLEEGARWRARDVTYWGGNLASSQKADPCVSRRETFGQVIALRQIPI